MELSSPGRYDLNLPTKGNETMKVRRQVVGALIRIPTIVYSPATASTKP